jgi:hypothetical protein
MSKSVTTPICTRPSSDKPPNPYLADHIFTATRHTPPPPFGGQYSETPEPDQALLKKMTQLDWCLSQSLPIGSIVDSDSHPFTIIKPLRTGLHCGTQIVLVRDAGILKVAKIYDPLYYKLTQRLDVVQDAAADYSIETAAYQNLQGTRFEGDVTAKFYGSWAIDVPLQHDGKEITRTVYMILLEFVEGVCMRDIDPSALSQTERDNIMVKLLEAESELWISGISNYDASRNVILCQAPANPSSSGAFYRTTASIECTQGFTDPSFRLCIIDFNHSVVHRLHPELDQPCPRLSPTTRWWGHLYDFEEAGWLENRKEWVWKMWEGAEKYVPAKKDPKDPRGEPVWPMDDDGNWVYAEC